MGENRHRGEWKKAKVVKHAKWRDRVVRGVVLLRNSNRIRRLIPGGEGGGEGGGRPLQLVCPIEIRSYSKGPAEVNETVSQELNQSGSKRSAADGLLQLTMQMQKSS